MRACRHGRGSGLCRLFLSSAHLAHIMYCNCSPTADDLLHINAGNVSGRRGASASRRGVAFSTKLAVESRRHRGGILPHLWGFSVRGAVCCLRACIVIVSACCTAAGRAATTAPWTKHSRWRRVSAASIEA